MAKRLDITGMRFGRLVAIKRVHNEYPTVTRWLFRCDCGNMIETRTQRVVNGITKSCGCLAAELSRARLFQHGFSHTSTGVSWQMMMNRCFNERFPNFKTYGAKGITPCEYVREGPASLIYLIGERPRGKSLDRINNYIGYYCGQCSQCVKNHWPMNIKWSTPKEQAQNSRVPKFVTFLGRTLCLSDWAKELEVERHNVREFIRRVSVIGQLLWLAE